MRPSSGRWPGPCVVSVHLARPCVPCARDPGTNATGGGGGPGPATKVLKPPRMPRRRLRRRAWLVYPVLVRVGRTGARPGASPSVEPLRRWTTSHPQMGCFWTGAHSVGLKGTSRLSVGGQGTRRTRESHRPFKQPSSGSSLGDFSGFREDQGLVHTAKGRRGPAPPRRGWWPIIADQPPPPSPPTWGPTAMSCSMHAPRRPAKRLGRQSGRHVLPQEVRRALVRAGTYLRLAPCLLGTE